MKGTIVSSTLFPTSIACLALVFRVCMVDYISKLALLSKPGLHV
jgi:hypothetical protein